MQIMNWLLGNLAISIQNNMKIGIKAANSSINKSYITSNRIHAVFSVKKVREQLNIQIDGEHHRYTMK